MVSFFVRQFGHEYYDRIRRADFLLAKSPRCLQIGMVHKEGPFLSLVQYRSLLRAPLTRKFSVGRAKDVSFNRDEDDDVPPPSPGATRTHTKSILAPPSSPPSLPLLLSLVRGGEGHTPNKENMNTTTITPFPSFPPGWENVSSPLPSREVRKKFIEPVPSSLREKLAKVGSLRAGL